MTNTAKQDCYDVIIIGSGLSGVTAARYLTSKGKDCLILDKGRRIGGRCSTKRKDGMTFNHGAQFFTAKHEEFIEVVDTKRGSIMRFLSGILGIITKPLLAPQPCVIS